MRRLLATLLAVILVFSLIPATAYATQAPTFTLSTEADNLKVGDTFTVSVDLSGNTGFISMKLGLSWNDKVVTYKSTDLTDSIIAGATVNSKKPIVTYASAAVNNANGKVFSATFEVIAEGDCNIAIRDDNEEFFDANQTAVNVTLDSSALETMKANPAVTKSAVIIADGIVGGTVTADKNEAEEGETVTLTVTPDEGYELDTLAVLNGETTVEVTNNSFTMPAGNVTVSATFKLIPAGYNVSLQCADNEIIAAYGETPETAEVTVAVSNTAANAYNAYNLFLSYPEDLTYVSAVGSGVENDNFEVNHDETARTIQVIGYGANKTLNQSPVKLTFSGTKVGEYDVTLTEAYMDAAGNANAADAPEATIQTATVTIQVTGYTVTLGEGLTADSLVAVPSQDFTFRPTDSGNYDYEVTAKIGENTIPVETNEDGTYTIEAENITGNITITAKMTPKSYKVTINGVEAENATYNTPYIFNAAKEGHTIKSVTAKIGETILSTTNDGNGNYTIAGTDIKGAIIITIEWEAITPETVTVDSTGAAGFNGAESATKGQDYTFSFTELNKYEYTGLKVEVGEGDSKTDITDKLIKNENGSYTIPGNLITGPITITVTRTEINPFAVDVKEYLKLSDSQSIWLVKASGVTEGSVAKYDGMNMYWSALTETTQMDASTGEEVTTTTGYGAYAYLVISGAEEFAVLEEVKGKVSVAEKTNEDDIVTVLYDGNVNCTNKTDINDAQLVYNMYNVQYNNFEETNGGASMLKFLKADMYSDGEVNTQDAVQVVNAILNPNTNNE